MFEWIAQAASTVVNAVVDTVENIVSGGGDNSPNVPPPCEVGSCPDAVHAARVARGDQKKACIGARFHMMLLLGAIRLATPSPGQAILIVILFMIAFTPFIGIFLALLAYFLLLVFIRAWSPVAEAALRLLGQASLFAGETLAEVRMECPEDCIAALPADLTNPEPCDVIAPTVSLANLPFNNVFGFRSAFKRR